MRAMFRALVEVRALSKHAGRKRGIPAMLEACWVGTAIDLQAGDLVSGVHAEPYGQLIQAIGTRKTDRAATATDFRGTAERVAAVKPFPGSASDAVCCAIGQAMALGAAEGKNIAVTYAGADDLTPAEWTRVLAAANQGALPLTVVTVPVSRSRDASTDLAAVVGSMAGARIPVIPVDAGDAVALYRVMQETCVRARADGGVAVIECVRCGTDPVRLLAEQLKKKGICTESWISKVEEGVQVLQQLL